MDEHMPIWLSYKPNSYIIPWDRHLQPIQTADDFLKPSTARSDESNFPNNNPYDSSTILFNLSLLLSLSSRRHVWTYGLLSGSEG